MPAPSKGDQNYSSWVDSNGEYVENPRKHYCSESFCFRVTASLAEPLDSPQYTVYTVHDSTQ